MKRTPEMLAKVIRLMFCKSCHGSKIGSPSYRFDRSVLRALSGQPKLDRKYLLEFHKYLMEYSLVLLLNGKNFVITDFHQLSNYPSIPKELIEKVLPGETEIDFMNDDGCGWSFDNPVWDNQ